MIRWTGATLAFLACAAWGILYAGEQARDCQQLRQLCQCLDLMICHLQYQALSLPGLCQKMASASTGQLQHFWQLLQSELEQQILPQAPDCVRCALSRCPQLPQSLRGPLLELGSILGAFDLSGQVRTLEALHSRCQQQLVEATAHMQLRLRSYRTLGLCAGAALVLLLL